MRIVDLNQTNIWLHNKCLLDSNGNLTLVGYKEFARYAIPNDCGQKTALAKVIATFFQKEPEALLWINEFGIWPSCEDCNLFLGFRKSLGETSSLYEKPGHLFSGDDIETVASLLSIVLYFFWGAVLIPASKKYSVKISHDEVVTILALKKGDVKEQLVALERIIKSAS
ncbi:MAG: hypothetical protein WAN11_28250 [Syntrophobacteraceae bacterium]